MKKVIIFDLDGTLVDVVPLFINILNTLASEFDYSPLKDSEVSDVKKINLSKFLFQKLGLRFWKYKAFHHRGRALYHEQLKTIEWFPGMPELYRALQTHGLTVGVISTNAAEAITELLAEHNLRAEFILSTSFFGKAKAIAQTIKQQGVNRSDAIYIGDELRDIKACQKAGIDIIAVSWGLNAGEVLKATGVPVADTVEELERMLLKTIEG